MFSLIRIDSLLRSTLGQRSLIKLAALLGFCCWPIAFFWSHLTFDAAKFTEEWLKSTLMTVVLFAAVRYLTMLQKAETLASLLKTQVIPLLRSLRSLLEDVLEEKHTPSTPEQLRFVWRSLAGAHAALAHSDAVESNQRISKSLSALLSEANQNTVHGLNNELQTSSTVSDLDRIREISDRARELQVVTQNAVGF